MAAEFRMTEDDAAGPDASAAEDLLELRLLTAEDQGLGPVDFPVKDHRLDEVQIDDEL
ncbi:hypothetical protein [Arthrobacter humicola]